APDSPAITGAEHRFAGETYCFRHALDCTHMGASGVFVLGGDMLIEIIAGTESTAGSGEYDHLGPLVPIGFHERLCDLLDELAVHRIEAPRPIEGDGPDPGCVKLAQDGLVHVHS